MSFFDEIKTEIQTEQNQKSNLAEQASAAQASQAASEPAPTAPVLPERMSEFVQEGCPQREIPDRRRQASF